MTKRFIAATAALCLAAGCASQSTEELGGQKSATLSKMDNMYFRDAAQSDMTEIQTSDMALQTSTNDQVKQFAQHMRNQHMQISAQAKALAMAKGATPPTMLDEKHEALVKSLQGKTGSDFDQAFVNLQIDAHQDAINLNRDEADNGNDPEVKNAAQNLLPELRSHLNQAKTLKDGMMPR